MYLKSTYSVMLYNSYAIRTQVMITKNLDIKQGVVNGARGIVIDFEKGTAG